MSVNFFDCIDLGRIACYAAGSTSSDAGKQQLEHLLNDLVTYSAANAAAFNASYGENVDGWTYADIKPHARHRDDVPSIQRIISDAQLLRYNLIAQNGKDFATVAIMDTLLMIANRIGRKTAHHVYNGQAGDCGSPS